MPVNKPGDYKVFGKPSSGLRDSVKKARKGGRKGKK